MKLGCPGVAAPSSVSCQKNCISSLHSWLICATNSMAASVILRFPCGIAARVSLSTANLRCHPPIGIINPQIALWHGKPVSPWACSSWKDSSGCKPQHTRSHQATPQVPAAEFKLEAPSSIASKPHGQTSHQQAKSGQVFQMLQLRVSSKPQQAQRMVRALTRRPRAASP